jgi:Rrf2 family protein
MKRTDRLLAALHVLAHLAAAPTRPLTSDELAACLRTHPVVIRRTLAGLRAGGIVTSAKGHGGGWTLARPPAAISLREVYVALGERGGPPVREPEAPGCPIEALVAGALDGFYAEATALLLRRLDGVSLADVSAAVDRRLAEQRGATLPMGAATGADAGYPRPAHGHTNEDYS